MQFIDLKTQQHLIRSDIDRRIAALLDHGQYILGPEVREMEQMLADYAGVEHCISVASGTDALMLALMALDIGPGEEVITTPFSFISTAEVIGLLGATPVFVDTDRRTFNIDPSLIEAAISDRTRAIILVSLFGQCSDMTPINAIADRHGLAGVLTSIYPAQVDQRPHAVLPRPAPDTLCKTISPIVIGRRVGGKTPCRGQTVDRKAGSYRSNMYYHCANIPPAVDPWPYTLSHGPR